MTPFLAAVAQHSSVSPGWLLLAQLITPISVLVGVGMVFIRIGRREEQIDTLAKAIDRLSSSLGALERIAARMEAFEEDTDRRLTSLESHTRGFPR